MNETSDYAIALGLARFVLDDETFAHTQRVCLEAMRTFPTNSNEVTISALHDVLEDSNLGDRGRGTLVAMGFSTIVCDSVKRLTHDRDVEYKYYIRDVGENILARRVKMWDLMDNMFGRPHPPSDTLMKRYVEAYRYLKKRSAT